MSLANFKAACMFAVSLGLATTALAVGGFGDVSVFVTAQTALVLLGLLAYLLKYLSENVRCEFLPPLLFSFDALPVMAGLVLVICSALGLLISTGSLALIAGITIFLVFFIGYSILFSHLGQLNFSESEENDKELKTIALTIVVTMIIMGFVAITLLMVMNDFV